jgi:hypothetical protein
MTDLRQAAQQALEALENIDKAMPFPVGKQAINALREALAQPEQQAELCIGKDPRCPCQDGDACHYKDCGDTKALPVPVAQPEQEPVAFYHPRNGFYWAKPTSIFAPTAVDVPPMPLYVKWKAAQRPWQGLTDEDKKKIATAAGCTEDDDGHIVMEIFRLAEIKLKERNT